VFQQIAGEHSVQQDLADTNPNFETGLDGYTLNCANCTVAYEMRRRGFDVEARPQNLMTVGELADLFEGFQLQSPMSKAWMDAVEEIELEILLWGEGANITDAVKDAVKNMEAI